MSPFGSINHLANKIKIHVIGPLAIHYIMNIFATQIEFELIWKSIFHP
jgi:hypothetical protein